MPILSSSLAVARGAGVKNTSFTPVANDVARNIVIIGTFDPSLAGSITAETVYGPYSSPGAVALKFGAGFMLDRLAIGVFAGLGTGGAGVYVIPQAEVAGAAATSTGFAITGPSTAAGTLAIYVDGVRYSVSVASGDSAITIATAIAAAITADSHAPITASNGGTANVTTTSKSKGPWGNSIPLAVNIQAGDSLPAGVGVTVTAMTGGTGVPTIANALNALGTGTNANNLPGNQWMTDLVHGYLASGTTAAATAQDQTTTTAVSTYNGLASADPPTGCYDHLVGKPFRCWTGDVTNSATVPSALTTFATTNTYDRTDQLICVAGSRTHPCEVAAVACGAVNARTGQAALRPYDGIVLSGVEPGPSGMWTADYTNRDTAVKAGLSPTVIQGGYVVLQNVVTYYANNTGIPSTSNGYRDSVNLAKLQNIIASDLATFRGAKWSGIAIVKDKNQVTDVTAKQYARDVQDVVDEYIALAKAWAGKGWIADATYTINALKSGMSSASPPIQVRTGGDGFTAVIPIILSGQGNIIDTTINFDISFAALAA